MEKILLILLPFWDPQIPPSGIACLKGFLRHHGCNVKTVDANTEEGLNEIYHRYFGALKDCIPEDRRGNFYKVGYDVLRHHLMAFLHRKDGGEYEELVESVVRRTFYVDIEREGLRGLDRIVKTFYARLEKYVAALLERERPTLLGISVYSGTLPASLFAFKLAKERYPALRTVMGGGIFADALVPGSPNLEFFLQKTPYIDKIVVGEGEILLLRLLQGRLDPSQRVYTLESIGGEVLDMAAAEVPDFSDFDLQYYPSLFSYSSRSCPFQCRFCTETLQWGKYRKKDCRQVASEFITLHRKYGGRLFMLGDSLLNPTIDGIAEESIKSGESIYWDGYLRVGRPVGDIGNTRRWRRGGFYRARLGIESGSQRVLDAMAKGITLEQIRASISSLARAGIKTTTYWLVGYPGETEADFQQTLQLVEDMADDIYEADCSPFWYFPNGQGGGREWQEKGFPLYPGKARDMLMLQTWTLDGEPSREETYRRMWRFEKHCRSLGIPNPYSLHALYQADERWRGLHKNAVPPLVDFKNKDAPIDEHKNAGEFHHAENPRPDDGDFVF